MFEAVEAWVREHSELEDQLADRSLHADPGNAQGGREPGVRAPREVEDPLADPSLHADPVNAKRVGQRYAAVGAVVRTYQEWQQTGQDLQAARELAGEDESFAAEAVELEARQA